MFTIENRQFGNFNSTIGNWGKHRCCVFFSAFGLKRFHTKNILLGCWVLTPFNFRVVFLLIFMVLGVGYAICLIDVYMGMYYNTIIGWAVYYLIASFTSELPWTKCTNEWNTIDCRPITATDLRPNVNSTTPAKEFFE